jgi:hypothetical protein
MDCRKSETLSFEHIPVVFYINRTNLGALIDLFEFSDLLGSLINQTMSSNSSVSLGLLGMIIKLHC